jgi:hypothetical protein
VAAVTLRSVCCGSFIGVDRKLAWLCLLQRHNVWLRADTCAAVVDLYREGWGIAIAIS